MRVMTSVISRNGVFESLTPRLIPLPSFFFGFDFFGFSGHVPEKLKKNLLRVHSKSSRVTAIDIAELSVLMSLERSAYLFMGILFMFFINCNVFLLSLTILSFFSN